MAVIWDEAHGVSYPAHRCRSCGATFFGGGPALHDIRCPEAAKGYEPCDEVIGPKALAEAEKNGTVLFSTITAEQARSARELSFRQVTPPANPWISWGERWKC